MASLMTNQELEDFVKVIRLPLRVERDRSSGTLVIKDGDEYCLRAIQKGNSSQPWIVMYFNTSRVKWKNIPNEELADDLRTDQRGPKTELPGSEGPSRG